MVVADGEFTLIRQAEPGGETAFRQLRHQRGDLLIVVGGKAVIQLLQMLLAQPQQGGKGHARCSTGGVEIPVFDGGVDAGICSLLHGLQHREQPPQKIGNIGGFVQAHSIDLLVQLGRVITQVICFDHGSPATGHGLLGTDAQGHTVQQGGGVTPAGQHGAQQVTG